MHLCVNVLVLACADRESALEALACLGAAVERLQRDRESVLDLGDPDVTRLDQRARELE